MRKRSAAGFYSSSLEMLLDTMCDMLGGVIFIALMVAIVAQDSVTPSPDQFREQTAQMLKEVAAITVSNKLVDAELRAVLLRLQDPRQRPRTNVMRLPDIANTAKKPWLVIVQRGKLYPLDVLSIGTSATPILNNQEVLYQRQTGYVEPRPEQGENPQSGMTQMIETFKSTAQTNYYFAFWVYDDSFPAFVRAREMAAKMGYQYGWTPLPAGERLKIGRQGERVLPQN